MTGGMHGSNQLSSPGRGPESDTIITTRSQEFLEIVTKRSHQTIICNGFVRKLNYPDISDSPSVDELVSHIAYFEKIIASMRHTKNLKTCFDRDHRTAEQKMRKHIYVEQHENCCEKCGKNIAAECHIKKI